jgi:hypothetical protein
MASGSDPTSHFPGVPTWGGGKRLVFKTATSLADNASVLIHENAGYKMEDRLITVVDALFCAAANHAKLPGGASAVHNPSADIWGVTFDINNGVRSFHSFHAIPFGINLYRYDSVSPGAINLLGSIYCSTDHKLYFKNLTGSGALGATALCLMLVLDISDQLPART